MTHAQLTANIAALRAQDARDLVAYVAELDAAEAEMLAHFAALDAAEALLIERQFRAEDAISY